MHPIIAEHRDEIARLCERHHVRRLDVFGSAARGDFSPEASDVDFLVRFSDDCGCKGARDYFGLLRDLEALFGRDVDLLTEGSLTNPYLIRAIEQSRVPIYASGKEKGRGGRRTVPASDKVPDRRKKLLWDVLEFGKAIQSFVNGRTLSDYEQDTLLRLAVERQFEKIGEALRRLMLADSHFAQRITGIADIIAFRNIIAHGYDVIDHPTVWQIIEDRLPVLVAEAQELLDELNAADR